MTETQVRIADEFGTPLYIYDLDRVRERSRELHDLLPAEANPRILYSFKANPLPTLARELFATGCVADLTSEGELRAAEEAGFDAARALYGGPGKGCAEIRAAIDAGVRQFSIESWHDLEVIASTARAFGTRVTGLLRVNPATPPRARVAMAGVASQFGFEESALCGCAGDRLRAVDDAVAVGGFHIYWGTQIADAEALAEAFRSGVQTADRLADQLGVDLEVLNLGGGFPWPYAAHGDQPDLGRLGEALREIRSEAGPAGQADWWFESGRYLVASSGTLVSRVMEIKESKDGRRFLVLDTGIHHLGGMSGLGRIPRMAIDLEWMAERSGEMTVDVVGQLCTPLDISGRKIVVPELEPGDLVSIPNVGAYGVTASLVGFLSRPPPREVAMRGDEVVAVHQWRTGHARIA